MAAKKLTMRVHGLAHQRFVDARVFASKLSSLVRVLTNTDKKKNGHKCLDFVISDLKIGSAVAEIAEKQASVKYVAAYSSVDAVHQILGVVYNGHARELNGQASVLPTLRRLSSGANKHFSHIEIYVDEDEATAVRVDEFFYKQVEVAESDVEALSEASKKRLFSGTAHSTFDGILKAVDLRGSVKQAKLVLTAGEIEIDCVCNDIEVPELGHSLDKRVRASGIAHYDGTTPLPSRLDIKKVQPIKAGADLSRWRGAFKVSSDAEDW
ncbi:MAG: hypothetical protein NDI90_00235 [Nitrospira sp. BO4]|jgi:hypothetical protein|nr:hypothetical protein [Nitrospira sp. BO4]